MIEKMPMIPLRGLVVFPNMVIHFDVGREKSILSLEKAMMIDQRVFLVSQKDPETALPTAEDVFEATLKLAKLPRNSSKVRIHNRCELTGRSHGFYRKLKLSRIQLRKLSNEGQVPGMKKSSW